MTDVPDGPTVEVGLGSAFGTPVQPAADPAPATETSETIAAPGSTTFGKGAATDSSLADGAAAGDGED